MAYGRTVTRDPQSVPTTIIRRSSELHLLDTLLRRAERVAIDTEVPIDGPKAGQLRVMSVATRSEDGSEHAVVVDVRDFSPRDLGPILAGTVADAWNATFDARVLDKAVWGSNDTADQLTWWDAQLADALIHQGRSGFNWFHGLAWAGEHYVGVTTEGKGTTQLSYTAFDDLTAEQEAYSAADAVVTLWVSDAIRSQISEFGLETICEIEMGARPFLDRMERSGLPFDWAGWEAELTHIEAQNRKVIGQLAEMTGGGQGNLFAEGLEPTWNPASDLQVRQALNQWALPEVERWTASRFGQARPLRDSDSVTASVLREIGGDLCDRLLEFRSYTKTLTTYGDSIHQYLNDDGRLRPQYLQVVGTNTGRLASRNPNAQNFTPAMKPFFRPADPDRVFVYADLSQAELRYLAFVSDDDALRSAFDRGDDVHVATASSMFGVDADQLRQSDPDRFSHLRQIAKALNFGIAYGTGARSLARSLTAEGSPTSTQEAETLLAQYRNTYPGTAAWAKERIAEVHAHAERTSQIDCPSTLRLARQFPAVASVRRQFRQSHKWWPSASEIAHMHPERDTQTSDSLVDTVSWVLGYSAPVALSSDGSPFTFSSRTLTGRRQQFNLHIDRVLLGAIDRAIRSDAKPFMAVRRQFEQENDLLLSPSSDIDLGRLFEDRSLRVAYVESLVQHVGEEPTYALLAKSAKERVSAMVNAWRNAPIQGGVADIMLIAYQDLHHRLATIRSAQPVQTVHDSVVIECHRDDAAAVTHEVRSALEQACARLCPTIKPKVDIDVRASLAETDVLA